MGFLDKLEDQWYAFLDGLDAKGIPVYKLIDPIDRIVPSFYLFGGLAVLLMVGLLAGVYFLFLASPKADFSVMVVDAKSGDPLPGIELSFFQPADEAKGWSELTESYTSGTDGRLNVKLFPSVVEVAFAGNSGYSSYSKSVSLLNEDGSLVKDFSVELSPKGSGGLESEEKTITLKDARSGSVIGGKRATFSFSCSLGVSPPPTLTSSSGSVTVVVPAGCGTLSVSVSVEGYASKNNYGLDAGSSVSVFLEPSGESSGRATLLVRVVDSANAALSGISVSVRSQVSNSVKGTDRTDLSGTVSFELDAGAYTVSAVSDRGASNDLSVTLLADQRVERTISLDIPGRPGSSDKKVFMVFKDADTGEKMVVVRSRFFSGGALRRSFNTAQNGELEFDWLAPDLNAFVQADAPGYFLKAAELDIKASSDNSPQVIELKKIAEDADTSVRVSVKYGAELGSGSVEDARVELHSDGAESYIYVNELLTGSDGKGSFDRVEPGTYYVKAFKERDGTVLSGKSGSDELSEGDSVSFSVVLSQSGKTTIRVSAADGQSGSAVEDFTVRVKKSGSSSVLAEKDSNNDGFVELEVDAGKAYEVEVISDGYIPFTTSTPVLVMGSEHAVRALLYDEGLDEPRLDWKGFFALNGVDEVTSFERNKSYVARMVWVMPDRLSSRLYLAADSNVLSAAGDLNVVIKDVNAPGSSSRYCSQSYLPADSSKFSLSGSCSSGNYKAANVVFPSSAHTYVVDVLVYVKPSARWNVPLEFHYDAQAGTGSSKWDFMGLGEGLALLSIGACPSCRFDFSFKVNGQDVSVQPYPLALNSDNDLNVRVINQMDENFSNLILSFANPGNQFFSGTVELNVPSLKVNESFSAVIPVHAPNYTLNSADVNVSLLNGGVPLDSRKVSFRVTALLDDLNLVSDVNAVFEKQLEYAFSGKVYLRGTTTPLSGVSVLPYYHNLPFSLVSGQNNTTNTSGVFSFRANPPVDGIRSSDRLPVVLSAGRPGSRDNNVLIAVKTIPGYFQPEFPQDCFAFGDTNGYFLIAQEDHPYKQVSIANNCENSYSVKFTNLLNTDLGIQLAPVNRNPFVSGPGDVNFLLAYPNLVAGLNPLSVTFSDPSSQAVLGSRELTFVVCPRVDKRYKLQREDAFSDSCTLEGELKKYRYSLFFSSADGNVNYNIAQAEGFPSRVDSSCYYGTEPGCQPQIGLFTRYDGINTERYPFSGVDVSQKSIGRRPTGSGFESFEFTPSHSPRFGPGFPAGPFPKWNASSSQDISDWIWITDDAVVSTDPAVEDGSRNAGFLGTANVPQGTVTFAASLVKMAIYRPDLAQPVDLSASNVPLYLVFGVTARGDQNVSLGLLNWNDWTENTVRWTDLKLDGLSLDPADLSQGISFRDAYIAAGYAPADVDAWIGANMPAGITDMLFFDVKPFVVSDGVYSFALFSSGAGSSPTILSSREGSFPPMLVALNLDAPDQYPLNLLVPLASGGQRLQGDMNSFERVGIHYSFSANEQFSGGYAVMRVFESVNSGGGNYEYFGVKLDGTTNLCLKPTDSLQPGQTGSAALADAFSQSSDYSWTSPIERCDPRTGAYCDGVQFLQALSSRLDMVNQTIQLAYLFGQSDMTSLLNNQFFLSELYFRSNLKKEGFSQDLLADFNYWAANESPTSPSFMSDSFIYSFLTQPGRLVFRERTADNTILSTGSVDSPLVLSGPGTYKMFLTLNSTFPGQLRGLRDVNSITVDLVKEREPAQDSVMLYLPWDDTVGFSNGASRNGYGVSVLNRVSSGIGELDSLGSAGLSGGLVQLNVSSDEDFYSMNSGETRGELFSFARTGPGSFDVRVALPSATPLSVLVRSGVPQFFYQVQRSGSTQSFNQNPYLGRWTGVYSTVPTSADYCVDFAANRLPLLLKDQTGSQWESEGVPASYLSADQKPRYYGYIFPKNAGVDDSKLLGLYSVMYAPQEGDPYYVVKDDQSLFSERSLDYTASSSLPGGRVVVHQMSDVLNTIDRSLTCVRADKNNLSVWWNEVKLFADMSGLQVACPLSQTRNYYDPAESGSYYAQH